MASLRGIKEKVHLPLYDSLAVRPRRQLRETVTSSVLKFFVDVQGKTKLETNLQTASLLPHWNVYEARALRVVVSGLPPLFPAEIEQCLRQAATGTGQEGQQPVLGQAVEELARLQDALESLPAQAPPEPPRSDLATLTGKAELHLKTISEVRPGLGQAKQQKLDQVQAFLEELENVGEEGQGAGLAADDEASRRFAAARLEVRERLAELRRIARYWQGEAGAAEAANGGRPQTLRECLLERLGDPAALPADAQLEGEPARILSTLIYNSVTTFYVGEKVMIQMPTWFFPAGAGPYSDDGRHVTHGLPSPSATFRFAEPIFIDTKQSFRVEIEIPERSVLEGLRRLYGPLFVWVVLDGFMVRDVQ